MRAPLASLGVHGGGKTRLQRAWGTRDLLARRLPGHGNLDCFC